MQLSKMQNALMSPASHVSDWEDMRMLTPFSAALLTGDKDVGRHGGRMLMIVSCQ